MRSLVREWRLCALCCLLTENDTDDESVQSERLGEDENENHRHEQFGLNTVGAHAGVTDDTDRETGAET